MSRTRVENGSSRHGVWRLWSDIRIWKGHTFKISNVLRHTLESYQDNLAYQRKYIMLPQGLKDLDQESDAFLSLLLRWFDRYMTYLVEIGKKSLVAQPLVKYSSEADIDALPYPEPQLIPTEPDTHKFYARILRAFLHLFSYPGMTTCRCEMEAELNTGLLLHSFFDWFATMSYSSSVHERFSSIRIFNRNSIPKWTTDGFSPIAFLPLPLKSMNIEIQFGKSLQKGRFNDREIPDFLVPLVTSIQPGLNAILLHEIAEWKKNPKKVKKPFVIPDWLFIHGIVYDAIEIQLYTCTPRITKCSADGVPLEWEFACLPTYAFYLRIYDDRAASRRLDGAIMLLKIKRHTARIAKALEELKSDRGECGLAALCKSAMIEEESREKGILDVFDIAQKQDTDDNGMQDKATECLKDCMNRTGLCSSLHQPDSLTNWIFFDTPGKPFVYDSRNFLREFLSNWRPPSGLLSLPEDWLKPSVAPISDGPAYVPAWTFFRTEPKLQMQISISPHVTSFINLSEEELLSRHSDPDSFAPDFFLAVPARKHREKYGSSISIDDLSPSTLHSLEHFKDIIQYMCHQIDAKAAISGLFKCIPGCWLRYGAQSRFPSELTTTQDPTDFSFLLHPIQTVPIQMETLTPDVMLRSTILNPALIIGIQGPTPWPDEFACPPSVMESRPKNKTEALQQLAKAIEPSLKIHLINWQLRFEQGLTPSRKLPPWFMLFGIIYDAQEVNIVAHIPVMDDVPQYSFISCIVDTISFPLAMPSSKVSEPWYLDRFRVACALLSLQKHAFRMATLWECVAWPDEIVSWEEILEREHLGPVLTPSERGYMVEPHPMAQLYLKMHGSDETIDDDTVSMDDVDEGVDHMNDDFDFDGDMDEGKGDGS